jgi:RimJ/RimL family protein N-acetyltransferase
MTIALRPVAEDDLTFLNRLTNDVDSTGIFQWYGWHNPHRHRERWIRDGMLNDDGGVLLIADGADTTGLVTFNRKQTNQVAHCWEIGVIVAPEFRGKGYGTEGQRLMARYLFDHSAANRVEAATEVDNLAEQRALEKAGFTREGVLRGVGFRLGEWRDGVLYSMIRSDLERLD